MSSGRGDSALRTSRIDPATLEQDPQGDPKATRSIRSHDPSLTTGRPSSSGSVSGAAGESVGSEPSSAVRRAPSVPRTAQGSYSCTNKSARPLADSSERGGVGKRAMPCGTGGVECSGGSGLREVLSAAVMNSVGFSQPLAREPHTVQSHTMNMGDTTSARSSLPATERVASPITINPSADQLKDAAIERPVSWGVTSGISPAYADLYVPPRNLRFPCFGTRLTG